MSKREARAAPTPTFKACWPTSARPNAPGPCVNAVDSLTIIWTELMQSFKAKNGGRTPINAWGDIKAMWGEYTTRFLNSADLVRAERS